MPVEPERSAITVGESGPSAPWVGVIAFLFAVVFLLLRVMAHDGDITSLIRIGEARVEGASDVPPDLAIIEGAGYDGQYFYRQAIDPLSTAEYVEGIALDRAAYRSARITYPAVVWLFSLGGQRELVWWMMPLVNALSVGVLGWAAASVARRNGKPTWLGLLIPAVPGMVVGLAYNLAEPLEAALVLTGLLAAERRQRLIGALLLSAAVLARESALVLPAAFLATLTLWPLRHRLPSMSGRWTTRPSALCALLPIASWISIRAFMDRQWSGRAQPIRDSHDSVDHLQWLPFQDFATQAWRTLASGDLFDYLELAQGTVIVWLVIAGFRSAFADHAAGTPVQRIGLVVASLLLSLVGGWERMVVFLRWPDIALILAMLFHLQTKERLPRWASTDLVARVMLGLWISVVPLWILA